MVVEVVGQSEEEKRRRTCKNCGAILSYYRADVKVGKDADYTGDKDEYHYIDCPQCKERLYLKSR